MNLNSIIFTLIINFIKLLFKALIPYFKFILFIIAYVKPILLVLLIYLLIGIIVTSIKKYKQSIRSNNKYIHSTLEKTNTNISKKCNECKREIKSTTEKNEFKQTNLALIFTGISLLINPVCIFSILGIIFGIMQLTDNNNNNNRAEKSWTIVSIIVSILITLLWIFILRNKF